MHSDIKKDSKNRNQQKYRPLILIVDNDRDNLLLASCVVDSMEMNYSVVDDPQHSLALVYELLPDIILLDIVMPKISGLEIIRDIKKDKRIARTSIIAVTGLTYSEYKADLIDAGCDDYLSKPYLIEELESKIYSNLKCPLI